MVPKLLLMKKVEGFAEGAAFLGGILCLPAPVMTA